MRRRLRDQCSRRGFRRKESKAALKTRLATTHAAEAKRNLVEVTQEGWKRERAPAKGAMVSDNPTKPVDLVGKRERAPADGDEGLGYAHAVFGLDPRGW